jgi:hypothetical protein
MFGGTCMGCTCVHYGVFVRVMGSGYYFNVVHFLPPGMPAPSIRSTKGSRTKAKQPHAAEELYFARYGAIQVSLQGSALLFQAYDNCRA